MRLLTFLFVLLASHPACAIPDAVYCTPNFFDKTLDVVLALRFLLIPAGVVLIKIYAMKFQFGRKIAWTRRGYLTAAIVNGVLICAISYTIHFGFMALVVVGLSSIMWMPLIEYAVYRKLTQTNDIRALTVPKLFLSQLWLMFIAPIALYFTLIGEMSSGSLFSRCGGWNNFENSIFCFYLLFYTGVIFGAAKADRFFKSGK